MNQYRDCKEREVSLLSPTLCASERLTVHTRTAQLLVNPVEGAAAGVGEELAAARETRPQRAAAVRLRAHRSIAAPLASQRADDFAPRRVAEDEKRDGSSSLRSLPPHKPRLVELRTSQIRLLHATLSINRSRATASPRAQSAPPPPPPTLGLCSQHSHLAIGVRAQG